MKKLTKILKASRGHWVGDGFPVRNIFSYNDFAKEMSPFLLMDYAGPVVFPPTDKKLGVGEHPHRGFETVSIVYDAEVEHRDSSGGGGVIGPGEVQWMTAGSGIVHEEFHGTEFAKKGGLFHMIQLWVNLAKKNKMVPPRYQSITKNQIPEIETNDGKSLVRVIAGEYLKNQGPAKTYSPMNVWDVRLKSGEKFETKVTDGHTTAVFVLGGLIKLASGEEVKSAELALFERTGDHLIFEVIEDTILLFLSGEPFNEPIVGHGPFVMNTQEEIHQAIQDYQRGLMGHLK